MPNRTSDCNGNPFLWEKAKAAANKKDCNGKRGPEKLPV